MRPIRVYQRDGKEKRENSIPGGQYSQIVRKRHKRGHYSTKVPELAPSSLTLNTSFAQASTAAFLLMGPGVFTAKLEKSLNLSVDNNFQKNCLT
jgi:hypothetical protein